jgi:integrase
MSEKDSTPSPAAGKPTRPSKPNAEYPLFPHATGQWAKKIRGRMHYFGLWSDPDAALKKYEAEKEALYAGRTPRADPEALKLKDVANSFLNAKQEAVKAGELSPRTWADYRSIMDMLVQGLGKHRGVTTLEPQDFAALKAKLARRNGPHRMCTVIQVIRCAFKHAYETGAMDKPMRFGPSFKRTAKKVLRLHRARQGAKLFTAEEVRALAQGALVVGAEGPELVQAGPAMRAMILLGINCGLGNQDCGTLPLSAVDLEAGMIDFPRPKTGLPRRCPLWPETIRAIRDALAARPEPKNAADAGLVFITKYGQGWAKADNAGPLTQAMRKLLNKFGINGHRNFYALRHSFRTVADGAKDQPAADFIMGHEVSHISSVYREGIDDERLRAVAAHVRMWLFGNAADAAKSARSEKSRPDGAGDAADADAGHP